MRTYKFTANCKVNDTINELSHRFYTALEAIIGLSSSGPEKSNLKADWDVFIRTILAASKQLQAAPGLHSSTVNLGHVVDSGNGSFNSLNALVLTIQFNLRAYFDLFLSYIEEDTAMSVEGKAAIIKSAMTYVGFATVNADEYLASLLAIILRLKLFSDSVFHVVVSEALTSVVMALEKRGSAPDRLNVITQLLVYGADINYKVSERSISSFEVVSKLSANPAEVKADLLCRFKCAEKIHLAIAGFSKKNPDTVTKYLASAVSHHPDLTITFLKLLCERAIAQQTDSQTTDKTDYRFIKLFVRLITGMISVGAEFDQEKTELRLQALNNDVISLLAQFYRDQSEPNNMFIEGETRSYLEKYIIPSFGAAGFAIEYAPSTSARLLAQSMVQGGVLAIAAPSSVVVDSVEATANTLAS